MIAPKFSVEGLLPAIDTAVEKRVERCRVVVVARMAELMQDDELAKVLREQHDEERERYAIAGVARAPARMCRRYAQRRVVEAVARSEVAKQCGKGGVCLAAQTLDIGACGGGQRGTLRGETLARGDDPLALTLQELQGPATRDEEWVANTYRAIGAHHKTNGARTHSAYALHLT